MEFEVPKSDSSLFIRKGHASPICILLYMDNMVITGADLAEIGHVKSQLSDIFKMKDLGDLHYFLGMEVIHSPDGICWHKRPTPSNLYLSVNTSK